MSGKWVTPAWTGPGSPQGPVKVAEPTCPAGECDGYGCAWTDPHVCTCGAGPRGYYGQHEHYCGAEPCPAGCAFVPRPAPPDFPQYRAAPIAACPECLGDCIYEGGDGWRCPACDRTWTHQQVAYFDEGQPVD